MQLDRHRTHVPIPRKRYTPIDIGGALPGAVAALGSLLAAALVLRLWDGSLRVPLTLGSEDAVSVLIYMKTTLEQLWPIHNPLLGAPFGQDLQDYPLGDPAQIVLTKAIGLFSNDVALVTNLFFLLTFPLAAMSAVWAFRRLGCATWPAVVCAILFALAPYHFLRGEDHLMIAAYYAVPFSCFLIVRQLAGDMPGMRTTVVLSLAIGLAFTYYLVFTLILLGFGVLVSIVARRRDAVRQGVVALAVIAVVAGVAHMPTWVYDQQHGSNPVVELLRGPDQSERFSLKLTRLILPVEGHRAAPLADLTANTQQRAPSQLQEGPTQALGLAAALAFLWLLWVALSGLIRPPSGLAADVHVRATAVATLATTLLGVVGGFSLVIAYGVSPLIRSWSRLSILLSFFALLVVARVLERGVAAMRARGVMPLLAAAALALVAVVGVLDQTTTKMVPPYEDLATAWHSDQAFATQAAARLPEGSMVFQMPYAPFPETTYQNARPYLHTQRLRWTFGAMAGRPADWTEAIELKPIATQARLAAAAGAAALHLNKGQYPDGGRAEARALQKLLGPPVVVSPSGAEQLYDLRPLAAMQAKLGAARLADLRRRVLHPVQVLPGPTLSAPQVHPDTVFRNRVSFAPRAELSLVNPFDQPRSVELRLIVSSPVTPSEFQLHTPAGTQAFKTDPTASIVGQLELKPGSTKIQIRDLTDPLPFDNVYFSINRVEVDDLVVRQAGS